MKPKILIILSSFIALIIAFLIIIANPQWYYFKDKLEYKNFLVYYDKSLPNKTIAILEQVETLITKSPFYRPNLKFKIFLKSDFKIYNLLPFQFMPIGYGRSVQFLSNNIYISKADIETNSSHNGLGHTRLLSSVLAHEVVHVLIEKQFGYFFSRLRPYFKKYEFSQMGLLWKEEGYAEYIAGRDATIKTFEEGIAILGNKKKSEYNKYLIEYFKCWVAIKYLLEVEKIEANRIFQEELILDDVISKAIKYYDN
jgi:hypothetical protein